jgi:hypothetical protein
MLARASQFYRCRKLNRLLLWLTEEGVSRQFLYRQKRKAVEALDEAFAARDDDKLFHLPVTEGRLIEQRRNLRAVVDVTTGQRASAQIP